MSSINTATLSGNNIMMIPGHLLGTTAISVVYVGRGTPLLKPPNVRPLLDQLKAATENYG